MGECCGTWTGGSVEANELVRESERRRNDEIVSIQNSVVSVEARSRRCDGIETRENRQGNEEMTILKQPNGEESSGSRGSGRICGIETRKDRKYEIAKRRVLGYEKSHGICVGSLNKDRGRTGVIIVLWQSSPRPDPLTDLVKKSPVMLVRCKRSLWPPLTFNACATRSFLTAVTAPPHL